MAEETPAAAAAAPAAAEPTPAAAPAAAAPATPATPAPAEPAAPAAPTPAAAAPAAAPAAAAPTEGEKPGSKAGEAQPPSKVPEKYSLTVQQGADAYADADDVRDIEELCRKAGFSNEEAQAVLDEHVVRMHAISERYRQQTEADPVYGGEHLAETARRVKLAIDKLRPEGHPERDAFNRLLGKGYGNHPSVVKFLADLGAQLDEAQVGSHSTPAGGGQRRSTADVLFGDAKS